MRGTRGTVPWLSFGTKSLVAGTDGQAVASSTGRLDGKDLRMNSDGTFEIAVSRDPQDGQLAAARR